MSACGVDFALSVSGTKSSGGMNCIVPPTTCALHDNFWSGSRTAVIKSKSARQARWGVSMVTRMFDCPASKLDRSRNGKPHTPLRSPCVRLILCRYCTPLAAPCNYRRVLAQEVAEKVKSRTSSSLLMECSSMNSMMLPPPIHSDTVENCRFFASSLTPTNFKMFGCDRVLQRTTSL